MINKRYIYIISSKGTINLFLQMGNRRLKTASPAVATCNQILNLNKNHSSFNLIFQFHSRKAATAASNSYYDAHLVRDINSLPMGLILVIP